MQQCLSKLCRIVYRCRRKVAHWSSTIVPRKANRFFKNTTAYLMSANSVSTFMSSGIFKSSDRLFLMAPSLSVDRPAIAHFTVLPTAAVKFTNDDKPKVQRWMRGNSKRKIYRERVSESEKHSMLCSSTTGFKHTGCHCHDRRPTCPSPNT